MHDGRTWVRRWGIPVRGTGGLGPIFESDGLNRSPTGLFLGDRPCSRGGTTSAARCRSVPGSASAVAALARRLPHQAVPQPWRFRSWTSATLAAVARSENKKQSDPLKIQAPLNPSIVDTDGWRVRKCRRRTIWPIFGGAFGESALWLIIDLLLLVRSLFPGACLRSQASTLLPQPRKRNSQIVVQSDNSQSG
jgi:hypothetical protein